jgi:16S rRNA (cytosine1402-N4)-methyltransferase
LELIERKKIGAAHIPVMTREILGLLEGFLDAGSNAFFKDATLGGGGHAASILEKFPKLRLAAFDLDAEARMLAAGRLSEFGSRVRIISGNFRTLASTARDEEWPEANGILFDLGVSNMQLTTPRRGFSYQEDGPLDMRMDDDEDIPSAKDILAESDVRTLAKIFREYGEERYAYQIAKAVTKERERSGALGTTGELTSLIRAALPAPVQRKMGGHPARRVFQALRIAVNSELDALEEGLDGALVAAGNMGAIIVISYHSLEDRIVKRRFLKWARDGKGEIFSKRPLTPSEDEINSNRSSRSAKMRAFIKDPAAKR